MASVARADTAKGGSSQLKRAALRALALAGVVGLSLLASACGGHSSGAKVAQVGTNGNAHGSGSSSASGSGDPRAFSACMRSHGIANFPDPDADGRIRIGSEIDGRSPTVRAAYRACRSLASKSGAGSGSGQGDVMHQQQLLAFAKCMRSHGVPAFPDPQVVNDHIRIRVTPGAIDPNSPVVTAAEATCRSKLGGTFDSRGAEKLVRGAAGSATGGPTGGKGK